MMLWRGKENWGCCPCNRRVLVLQSVAGVAAAAGQSLSTTKGRW